MQVSVGRDKEFKEITHALDVVMVTSTDRYNQVVIDPGVYRDRALHMGRVINHPDALVVLIANDVTIDSPNSPIVYVSGGEWAIHGNVTIGDYSRPRGSQNALLAEGHGTRLECWNMTTRTGSLSGAVWADHGATIDLRGPTRINAEMSGGDTGGMRYHHAGITARHGGHILCGRKADSLILGSGHLSASMGGKIELGWPEVNITSHAHQANCLAINDDGRIMFRGSTVHVNATDDRNAVLGFEGMGYCMYENAMMVVDCTTNSQSISLQKHSFLVGGKHSQKPGTVLVRGDKGLHLSATLGSQLEIALAFEDGGRLEVVHAHTGAMVHIAGDIPPGYRVSKLNGGRVFVNRTEV